MLRGVIAEDAFRREVLSRYRAWRTKPPLPGSWPYDFVLTDGNGDVRVQVKLQRSEKGVPKKFPRVSPEMYLVEPQKTRSGKRQGRATRPYRFGEFDVLAVATYAVTKQWNSFMYTVASWLLPDPADATQMYARQPMAMSPNDDWTDDFATAAAWFRSGQRKTIYPGAVPRLPKKKGTKERNRRN